MKQLLILLSTFILTTSVATAETITANYKVEFGIFGEIGIANATLTRDENSYEIDVELKATGISKRLSGNREERHISKGHIKDGVMISDMYQVIKSYSSKTTNKVYKIDHVNKTVTKEYKRWKKGKMTSDNSSIIDFYSEDDLLTLYFNLGNKIADKTKSKAYTFTAVGAEKQSGSVDVIIPEKNALDEYRENLGNDEGSWYARAIIHQDIFASDKGELLLRINSNGVTEEAVLKDLIFFGDIRAKRI